MKGEGNSPINQQFHALKSSHSAPKEGNSPIFYQLPHHSPHIQPLCGLNPPDWGSENRLTILHLKVVYRPTHIQLQEATLDGPKGPNPYYLANQSSVVGTPMCQSCCDFLPYLADKWMGSLNPKLHYSLRGKSKRRHPCYGRVNLILVFTISHSTTTKSLTTSSFPAPAEIIMQCRSHKDNWPPRVILQH